MKITYDPQVDAAYIYFETHPRTAGCVSRTEELSPDVNVDYGDRGDGTEEVIGVEVLFASAKLGLSAASSEVHIEAPGKRVHFG